MAVTGGISVWRSRRDPSEVKLKDRSGIALRDSAEKRCGAEGAENRSALAYDEDGKSVELVNSGSRTG